MEQQDLQINHYVRLFWKGKWIILLTTLLGLGGVLLFEQQQPPPIPSFQATSTFMVEPVSSPVGGVPGLASAASGERSLNTQIELMVSRNVMERALAKLEPPPPGEEVVYSPFQIETLRSAIRVRPISTTNLLEVRARGTTPDQAQQRANAVVEAYVDYIKDERVRTIEDSLADLRTELDRTLQSQDSQSQVEALLPSLGTQLVEIATAVERGAQTLEQLQNQETPETVEPPLRQEVAQIDTMAEDLASISDSLHSIRQRLDGAEEPMAETNESPLLLEATRLETSIQELEEVHQQIESLRSDLQRLDPASVYSTLAIRASNIEESLDQISPELAPIRGDTVETSRQLVAIREYVASVADDMGEIGDALQDAGRTSGMSQSQRILLEGRMLSFTLGLQSAANDLDSYRSLDSDIRDYGRILTAKGQLETSITLIESLKQDLEGTAESNSLDDALGDVLRWLGDGQDSLRSLVTNFRDLAAVSESPDPELVVRVSSGIDSVVIILDTSATRLTGLQASTVDPFVKARMNGAAAQLAKAQIGVAESAARLTAATTGETVTLADRVGVVQNRIQASEAGLKSILEDLQVPNHLPSTVRESDVANQAYVAMVGITRSLDIASRQLSGLQGGGGDPILQGELSFLNERLALAQERVSEISQSLLNIATGSNLTQSPDEAGLVQERLETAATAFRAAARHQEGLDLSVPGAEQAVLDYSREQTDIGAAILARVQQDLADLQAAEPDPLRYGQLVVMAERITNAQLGATEVSSQFQQLQGGPGPEYLQMRKLEQQLELSLLHPQDTGITLVDSAVTPQSASEPTIFDGLRIPMGALAGLFLGGLAVFLRSQMDQNVRTQARLRDQVGVPSLGVVPKGRVSQQQLVPMFGNQRSPAFAEALQLIGTRLSVSLNNGVRSFLITSSSAKEGKTMLVANLAQLFAQYGKKVLIIDGNLRKPELAKALGIPNDQGLATALAQHRNPSDFVVWMEHFAVLPAGQAPGNPAELLTTPAMAAFLQQAQRDYDVVLIDSPPAVGFAETKALAKEVGAIVLVVRSGGATVDLVNQSREELGVGDVPLVGAVLNFASSEECSHLKHEKYGAARPTRGRIFSRGARAGKAAS